MVPSVIGQYVIQSRKKCLIYHHIHFLVARQSLAKASKLRVNVKQRITAQQSVAHFRDTDITGNVNDDYVEPFNEIHPISRCFSKLLMP